MPYLVTRKHQGIALVVVTWLLLILAMIAAATLSAVRYQATTVSTQEIRTVMKYAIEGAIQIAIFNTLTNPKGRGAGPASSTYKVGEYTVNVLVQNESGLININRADSDLISAMFAANHVDKSKAMRLAATILDWRDTDNLKRVGGAETIDYRNAGIAYGPRNSAFETKGELANIKGLSVDLYHCIAPLITVYSSSSEVNISMAAANVTKVFQWAKKNNWQGATWNSVDRKNHHSVLNPSGRGAAGNTYTLLASAKAQRNIPMTIRVTVRFTRGEYGDFEVLDWREIFVQREAKHSC